MPNTDTNTDTGTNSEAGAIDFTIMYATHNAFRRDLARLSTRAEPGTLFTDAASAVWQNFKRQLHIHHTVEDAELWPRVLRAVADREDDLLVLQQMEAEHEQLGPLLEKVDEALAGRDMGLADGLRDLATALDDHMRHEERSALPLIQRVLTPQDWKAFRSAMARSQGPKGAAVYVPWVVDGVDEGDRRAFFAAMPAPLAVVNRLFMERSYRRKYSWPASRMRG